MSFETYVGIDYSGAGTPQTRSRTIQVFSSQQKKSPRRVSTPASNRKTKRNWNRDEVYRWLIDLLGKERRVIVGIDHAFSFPRAYFQRHGLSNWDEFLDDFAVAWPTDKPEVTIEELRQSATRTGSSKELRLTERWTSSAKSVFQFDVQGSVAKSTHAGLPFLQRIREGMRQLHFWPFDGFDIPPEASVIAEIYPSLFRNRYPRAGRTVDEQDAYSVCRWLREMDGSENLNRFFDPPLDETQRWVAQKEGWILGVM